MKIIEIGLFFSSKLAFNTRVETKEPAMNQITKNQITKIEVETVSSREWSIVATYEQGNKSMFGNVLTEKGAASKITQYAKRFGLKKIDRFTAVR